MIPPLAYHGSSYAVHTNHGIYKGCIMLAEGCFMHFYVPSIL